MIEQRLKQTLDQVAAGGPDEAGAFDRFLRRRARRSRGVAGATALALTLVLASAVALPRLGRDAGEPPRLYVSGQPAPEHWQPGPLVAVAPVPGFEVEVPAGWEATATWKGIALRPASPELRRRLAGPVQLDTSFLEERHNPAPNVWKDGTYVERGTLPKAASPTPRGDLSSGSFPRDRRWLRIDGRDGRWRTTQWHISWPYRCERGVPCPAPLAFRTLRVTFQAEDGAWPRVAGLAERLLGTARPIANAVAGQRHAPRPDCVDGRTVVARRLSEASDYGSNGRFGWSIRTTGRLVPCTLRGPLAVEILAGGRRAEVQGNADLVVPEVEFPEGTELRSGQVGVTRVLFRWSNWCGGPARIRWLDGADPTAALSRWRRAARPTPGRRSCVAPPGSRRPAGRLAAR